MSKLNFAPKYLTIPRSRTWKYFEEGVAIRTFLSETVSAEISKHAAQGDTWTKFDWGKSFTGSPKYPGQNYVDEWTNTIIMQASTTRRQMFPPEKKDESYLTFFKRVPLVSMKWAHHIW